MDGIRLYFKYLKLNIESQLQYKASFIMMSLGHFLITFVEFLGLWVLFDKFGNIKGFTFEEVALFYGIVHIAFSITEGWTRGFDIFPSLVKMGDFDRILLRPRTTILQVLGHSIQMMRIGRLLQGLVVLQATLSFWSVQSLEIVNSFTYGGVRQLTLTYLDYLCIIIHR